MATVDAISALEAADVPCARVLSRQEVFDDPQVVHNGLVVEEFHATAGRIRTVLPPAKFSGTPTQLERQSPGKGEHTDEILLELGFHIREIEELRANDIVA